MIRKLTSLLIVAGLAMLGFSLYEYVSVQQEEASTVGEIEELLDRPEEEQSNSSWFSFFGSSDRSSSSTPAEEEQADTEERAISEEETEGQRDRESEVNESEADPPGESEIGRNTDSAQEMESSSNSTEQADAFNPQTGEGIALLHIPSLDAELPVVEGVDANSLRKGVGHMAETALPGQGEQILLSGHRDTTFTDFGELEIGDRFIVELPYGTYEYEMRDSEIVDREDRSIIRPMGEEVLTLSTCYPFHYLGDSPERFIIYAYPVNE
ncbi:class D sortase [Sinobaca sp. H24]|uniref:class D sortase n=1 Tax=Sinobaca sp. H24 TaxID=2923376 RepID=UPI00207A7867|nr:class D sortase [Sinobaca sp. H24]